MNILLHAPQVEFIFFCIFNNLRDASFVCHTICHADCIYSMRGGLFQFLELAADARVDFIVAAFAIAQPHGHASLDVACREEDDTTPIL